MRANHANDNGLRYLLIGVGLGLLAGLLCAPKRGDETREELRRPQWRRARLPDRRSGKDSLRSGPVVEQHEKTLE